LFYKLAINVLVSGFGFFILSNILSIFSLEQNALFIQSSSWKLFSESSFAIDAHSIDNFF
jgi:hypothetical protein